MVVEINILKTTWCVYCPRAIEIVNKVAAEFGNKVVVKITDLEEDENREIAIKHNVMSVPTILVNDEVAVVGMPKESDFRDKVKKAIAAG